MDWHQAEGVRDRVFRERVLPILRRHRHKASQHRHRQFLDRLERRLFEPDLRVTCNGAGFAGQLRQLTGQLPRPYVDQLRMVVFEELLRNTPCSASMIGELVGYPHRKTVARIFARTHQGMTPGEYRRRCGGPGEERPALGGFALTEIVDAFSGRGDVGSLARMHEQLGALLAVQRESEPPDGTCLRLDLENNDPAEREQAEAFWDELRTLPFAEQRDRIRKSDFDTPALFHLLYGGVRQEGRKHRKRGVAVARLALDALDALRCRLREPLFSNLLALGCAEMANAHRLALELTDAERSLLRARTALREVTADPRVLSELLIVEAALRWYQHRLDEALVLVDRVIVLRQGMGEKEKLAEALVMLGAIHWHAREPQCAAEDYRRVLQLAGDPGTSLIAFRASYGLATALLECGRLDEAETALVAAEASARQRGEDSDLYRIRWVQGLIQEARRAWKAASHFMLEARKGFLSTGDTLLAASVAMDLAAVCIAEGHSLEACELVAASLPVFDTLRAHPEGVSLLKLARHVVDEEVLDPKTIEAIRSQLRLLKQDPTISVVHKAAG